MRATSRRLSIKSTAPRLVRLARAGRRLDPRRGRPSRPRPSARIFRSLLGGMGELVSAIERRACPPARADPKRRARRLVVQRPMADRVATARQRRRARRDSRCAGACHRTSPRTDSIESWPAFARECPYVSTASVALAWPKAARPHPLRGSGFVVARQHSRLRITACTWVSSKWSHRAARAWRCCVPFSAALPIPTSCSSPMTSSPDRRPDCLAHVLGVSGATELRARLAVADGWRPASGRTSARIAQIDSRLARCPASSSPAAAFDPSAFPTASPTVGPPPSGARTGRNLVFLLSKSAAASARYVKIAS